MAAELGTSVEHAAAAAPNLHASEREKSKREIST